MQPWKKVKTSNGITAPSCSEDATAALRRPWFGYSSASCPITYLLLAGRSGCGEGRFSPDPWRKWQGSSVVFRKGCESEVQLRKGSTVKENQHVGEEQDDEGGSNISALCSAMLIAISKGLTPHCLRPWAAVSLGHGGKPDPWLVKTSPFGLLPHQGTCLNGKG